MIEIHLGILKSHKEDCQWGKKSCFDKKESGFKAAGITWSDLIKAGFTLSESELREEGYTLSELREEGFTVSTEVPSSSTEQPTTLRFAVGQRIEANIGEGKFVTAVVVQHHYMDDKDIVHPYQFLVDREQEGTETMNYCGRYVCVRWDEDVVVRKLSQSNKDQEYIHSMFAL